MAAWVQRVSSALTHIFTLCRCSSVPLSLSLSLHTMPRHDYPPGAFTAPATQQSVQHKLNQKGMSHEMAMQELESIAYLLH